MARKVTWYQKTCSEYFSSLSKDEKKNARYSVQSEENGEKYIKNSRNGFSLSFNMSALA